MENKKGIILGLIGKSLNYSFSQSYFKDKFLSEKIIGVRYENFELNAIKEITSLLGNEQIKGLNVTIPYKQAILPFVDKHTPEVQAIKACNCIAFSADRQTTAYNTDIIGIRKTLLSIKTKQAWQNHQALILGTGGASLAVQYVLKELNINFQLVSRTATQQTLNYEELTKDVLNTHTLIVNTTPLGTSPNIDECPNIAYQYLTKNHILFDLVYNPSETKFLRLGRQQGAYGINGLPMLNYQAEASWEIWNISL